MTTFPQDLTRKVEHQFGQIHAAWLVHRAHTTHIGCQIGQNKVYPGRTQYGQQGLKGFVIAEITLQYLDTRQGRHFEQVEGHDPPAGADDRSCILAPCPGGSAKVDDHIARYHELFDTLQL